MFRKKVNKGPGATELFLLQNPDPNVKELLDQDDLSTQFREKNPILIGYFLGKDKNGEFNMKKIFNYIMATKNRDDQKKLFSLYQMSNTCLHRVLSDSVYLSKVAFESIDRNDPFKQYAMGVFSRILSRAIDQWPEENWQVFWNIEGALEKVIKNLDSTCIYQSILDVFIQKQHPHISVLMWYIFLSFIPTEKTERYISNPPTFTLYIFPVDNLKENKEKLAELHDSLGKYHISNIISLFIEYFKCSMDKIQEFIDQVFDYVANAKEEDHNIKEDENEAEPKLIEFYPRLFEIAKIIGPNKAVIDKALKIIRESEDTSSLKVQYCAQYISVCSDDIDEKTISEIIGILLNEKSKQFTISAVLQLVSNTIEDDEKKGHNDPQYDPSKIKNFTKTTMEKIIKMWQELSDIHLKEQDEQSQSSFMLLDAILTIGRIIYNFEVNKIIQKKLDEEPKKKVKDNDEEEDEDYDHHDDEKANPKDDPELKNQINEIGSDWDGWSTFKDQIINWSKQEFIEFKDVKPEEREKCIIINFNMDQESQNKGQDKKEDQDDRD